MGRRILWLELAGAPGGLSPACPSLKPGALRLRMGGASGFMFVIHVDAEHGRLGEEVVRPCFADALGCYARGVQ